MAVTVQMQFESVVTELYQDAFVGSSIKNGTTIIQCDLRKLDIQRALGTTWVLESNGKRNQCKPVISLAEFLLSAKKAAYGGMGA